MKKQYIPVFLLFFLLLLLPTRAMAAWKTTDAGTIYTQKKSPGYVTGWKKINGAKYYFDPSNGVMATGFRRIQVKKKTYTYYFGTDGKAATGLVNIDGVPYAFKKSGRMRIGFFKLNGKTYYADPASGVLAKNIWIDGLYYFYADCSMAVNTTIDGKQVGADGKYNGTAKNIGFVRANGKTLYYNKRGTVVLGWLTINGTTYYMKPEMVTGAFKVGNYIYVARADGSVIKNVWKDRKYLSASGAATIGWATIGGKRYYFNANGNYVRGKEVINGKTYRFDSNGVLRTNYWYKTKKGSRYYYGADGARVSGLLKVGNYFYYFTKKGKMKTGFFKAADGSLYYANATKGYLYAGTWITVENYKYYANTNCTLAVGLNKIGDKLYGFSDQGRMYTKCWQTFNGNKYYFTKKGYAVVGKWKKISGKYYYFKADGTLATSTVVEGYSVDAAGVRQGLAQLNGGWTTISGTQHYVVNGESVTGWQTINGSKYYFDSTGAMLTGINEIGGKKYYFYPTGILAVNTTLAVSDKEYTINANGVVTAEKVISVAGTNKGAQIAKFAIKYVGNRYVYGGTSLTGGADCSGFVMTVFSNFGIRLLRVANDQLHGPSSSYIKAGYKKSVVVSPGYMLPGDLIFYGSGNYASHVAIYIGDGKVVHASNSQPYPAGGIKISNYDYQTPIGYVRYWS